MLKFNLTQEGKTAIAALQNNDKLAITHVRLLQSGNRPSVDLPIRSGAIVVDGTCNGPYAVVDVNDTSANNYLASAVALLSNEKSIAELYSDENASGYEVVLSCGMPGRTEYPSIKYRTKTWASGKIPSRVDIMKGSGEDCDVLLSFGRKGGDPNDPSQQDVMARITLGDNFPKTITFSNGDIWETDDTISTTGVKNGGTSYGASSEDGETSIRPLYSKVYIQKETNKQLKLRLSCQFDGAEKCKFNTTSINLPYATKFREGVVRFADPSIYGTADGQRYNTVYSAADVDKKIAEINNNLGNLTDYAKKATENTFAADNTFEQNVIVHGEIRGEAVATRGMNVNAKDTMVVSLGYADDRYLTKNDASSTYLTKTGAADTYLTKQKASETYLTQTVAADTYLTKTDANTAAANYAKLNADNNFVANTTNTFNGDVTVKGTFVVGESQEAATFAVTHDGIITGTAIQNDKVADIGSDKLPTEGAVKSALNDVESALQTKDNDLQSQIDGINAGQNLADIVNDTAALAAYDVSHLKAKGDSLPGKPSTPLTIGDKVQVLGGGDTDAQSCVYELIKGTKPSAEANSIQSTNNTAYYWHYIGVYGTNAYTKAEVNAKVDEINTKIGTKADKSYVDTELAKKVDKTQIKTTISGDTATDTNIPSASAVKTYVDGKVGDINTTLESYVTLNTTQEITGAKTFANGNITIANPNDGHKDKHYVTIGAAGNNTTSDYTSSIMHYDSTHNDYANDTFTRARPNSDPNKSSDNVSYTSSLLRRGTGRYTFGSKLEQHIGTHYNYTASDMYMTTGDPNEVSPLPAAQIGTPGNTGSTDGSLKENYVERIRLRKNTSTVDNVEGGFLSAGTSVTDIDLFADNINNVFNKEVSFRVCTPSGESKTDKSVLRIYPSGIWYRTQAGNTVGETEYQLRTAGSLDFTTSMSQFVGSDEYVPTTKAVADFVDDKIKGVTGGTAFVKTHAPNTNQNIDSAITVTEGITVGTNEKPANLTVSGIITGNGVSSNIAADAVNNGTKLPTCTAVATFVDNAITANKNAISDKTKIGAMGLFLYTGGDFKEMGTEVHGSLLHAVGMQLPMDGVVSWSQGDAVSTAAAETTWKLLNNTIAGEPCLVLAIRVG